MSAQSGAMQLAERIKFVRDVSKGYEWDMDVTRMGHTWDMNCGSEGIARGLFCKF